MDKQVRHGGGGWGSSSPNASNICGNACVCECLCVCIHVCVRVLGGWGRGGGVVAQMLVKFVKIYRNAYNGFIVWCVRVRGCVGMHARVCLCVWVHVCMHVCVCECVRACIHMWITAYECWIAHVFSSCFFPQFLTSSVLYT